MYLTKAGFRSGKVKSLNGGAVEIMVQNKVKWPHEFALSGSSEEHISYNLWSSGWLAFTVL